MSLIKKKKNLGGLKDKVLRTWRNRSKRDFHLFSKYPLYTYILIYLFNLFDYVPASGFIYTSERTVCHPSDVQDRCTDIVGALKLYVSYLIG